MDKKIIFSILVAVITSVLLIFKVITLSVITDNLLTIVPSLLAVFAWISREDQKKEKEDVKEELETLKQSRNVYSK